MKLPLKTLEFNSLWLDTDKMIYNLNNVRKKGHGSLRYDNVEDKLMQTQIIVSGDVDTGYIFSIYETFTYVLNM